VFQAIDEQRQVEALAGQFGGQCRRRAVRQLALGMVVDEGLHRRQPAGADQQQVLRRVAGEQRGQGLLRGAGRNRFAHGKTLSWDSPRLA
jgi:hypothetical protein